MEKDNDKEKRETLYRITTYPIKGLEEAKRIQNYLVAYTGYVVDMERIE